jgi:uncharacterized membrane protein
MDKRNNSIEEILKRLKSIDRRLDSIEKLVKGEEKEDDFYERFIEEGTRKKSKIEEQKTITPKTSKRKVAKDELPTLTTEKQEKRLINILHIIGIFALAIGVGLFIKYTFPIIGPWLRIFIGYLIGIGLLYLGEKLTKKYGIYALGISSCGIVILYFSFYASSAFYNLLPPAAAFLLMFLVTITGVLLSLRYDSSIISLIAVIGAFLTPYVFRGGEITPLALIILFSYLSLINGWILTVTKLKEWKWLNILTFSLTAMMLLTTIKFSSESGYPGVFLIFSTIFFALFFYIPKREKTESLVIMFLNPFLYYFVLWFVTYKINPYLAGTLALGLSVFFYYNGTAAERKKSLELAWSYITLAIFFLTIAIPVFLKVRWSTLAWAVEGTIILYMGRKEKVFRILPLTLLCIAVFKMFFMDYFLLEPLSFLFNSTITIVAVFLCAKFLFADREASGKQMAAALGVMGMLLVFWFTLTGTDKFFAKFDNMIEMKSLVISILWGMYSLVLFVFGIAKENSLSRIAGFIMASLTIIKVFFFDLSDLEAVYRIISLVILGVILLTISFIYQKKVGKSHDIK